MGDTKNIRNLAADILRANATKPFTTKCTGCGQSYTQSLRWLQTRRFTCPSCGGKLDDKPLHELTLFALRKMQAGTQSPQTGPGVKKQRNGIQKKGATSLCSRGTKYLLVLQVRRDSLSDFDVMVALEDELSRELGKSAEIDGHDCGAGETNIFIFTSDATATFKRIKPVLERRQQLQSVTAAYRAVEGERYTVIWPKDTQKEFRLL